MQALVTEFVRVLTRCCLPARLPTCLPAVGGWSGLWWFVVQDRLWAVAVVAS